MDNVTTQESEFPTPAELGQKASQLVNFQQIVQVSKLPTKKLTIPLWEGYIVIQAVTREVQHNARRTATSTEDDGEKVDNAIVEQELFAAAVIQPRFTKSQVDELFHTQPAGLMEDIMREVAALNKADEKALEEARASFR